MANSNQVVDLLISHSQIQMRSRPYDEALSQWGKLNIDQGAVLHKDYVIFDPLPDDAFGANIILTLDTEFNLDTRTQRCIVVPFFVSKRNELEVASAAEKAKVFLDVEERRYALYYEVCEGDEIFYKFTFVPSTDEFDAKYLMDDPWGGIKGKTLAGGFA
ncbi:MULTISPECIES: competence protein ComJ [Pseudomonas syringae group]|uniref:competence protein ComJ n=1 Tax=Pseudomonas syringae group TaxID=136849 RepID=UPI0006E51D6A|nr:MULTISPECIES: competence protein ComJ [Pseudomonas syringae group]KPW37231.1 hypothetical protein ALO66_200097 [Pseudomonas coronafaciens pv. atropurpurea]RMN22883.1 hypothetical protein ALQ62_100870 [Pseudomonas coronafaciens pv. zizaniae]RMT61117.1 hypothetical protein ALP45_200080 [Pseudomonas coronafaciens pv. atropurpurea]RMV71792.1 hypothetical protein ALP06_200009 [Pseudomonas coronafaciens pv. atropurpurea]